MDSAFKYSHGGTNRHIHKSRDNQLNHRKLAKSRKPWYSEQLLEFGIQDMVPESEPFLINH